jgi:methylmalonyl-CoA mutase C-terminal domain/subunit
VVEELKRRKATDIVVFGGGIIPDDDIAALKKRGVEKIFTPGTPLQDIVDWLRNRFPEGEGTLPASGGGKRRGA